MRISLLKSKLHKVCVTGADLNYEGSISIDPKLYKAAGMCTYEKVDIYNINNGMRFSTYIIEGRESEISLNGAAARLVQKGDLLIIVSYAELEMDEVSQHKPIIIFVDELNRVKEIIKKY